jgi:hypothetical protein
MPYVNDDPADQSRSPDPSATSGRGAAWYDGPVPQDHAEGPFRFVPLNTDLLHEDYSAVMATREHLRWWSDSSWPTDDFDIAENALDLAWHAEEHHERVAFTYSVLDAAATSRPQVVGCIYIRPFSSACSTRGVECPADLSASPEAVARGWLIDEWTQHRDALRRATLSWLRSHAWSFQEAWWQERLPPDRPQQRPGTRVIDGWSFNR